MQTTGMRHHRNAEISWKVGVQHLANLEHAPVNLDRTLAMRVVFRDPFKSPGHCEFSAHRRQRIGDTGTIGKGPVATHKSLAGSDQTSRALPLQPRRLRVVIVEDEAIVAMELEMLLEDMKADVVGIAMSAADAIALVQEYRPDFVTMDINIKGDRDGVSAALELFKTYGVRSIFISSYSDPATQKRGKPCHAIAWIKKPIDKADLTEAVSLVKRQRD